MPTQPPVVGGRKPKVAWAPTPWGKDKRKRGRAGVKERAEILAADPLCRPCLKQGRTRRATIVDHIQPLSWGGTDVRTNKQPICKPCHDAKSAEEREIGRKLRASHG